MLDDIYYRIFVQVVSSDPSLHSDEIKPYLLTHKNKGEKTYLGKILHSIYASNPESSLGLNYGQQLLPANLCDFSRMLMTANALQDSLQLIQQFSHHQSNRYYPIIHHDKQAISVALTFPYRQLSSPSIKRFFSEAVFVYIINAIHSLIHKEVRPIKVSFDFPRPPYAHKLESLFNCPIKFEQAINCIWLPASLAQAPLNSANPTLHHIYKEKCQQAWQHHTAQSKFKQRTINAMLHRHPLCFNSLELANELNLSVRGLQNKLSGHHTSVSALTNQVRRELIKIYLHQQPLGSDQLANRLGFQTEAGLRKYVKNEFNLTVNQLLKNTNRQDSLKDLAQQY